MLDRNPRVSFFTYALLARCPLLLPHDRSYLGIRLIKASIEDARPAGSPPPLILDIGANNGISSRGFIKLLPGWKVRAIEANSLHIPNLQRIKNQFEGQFDFTIGAAGNRPRANGETIKLFTPVWKGLPLHTVTSTRENVAMETAVEVWKLNPADIEIVPTEAPLLSVDDLNLSPSIVKIDAEGSEKSIIEGMSQTLQRSRPVVIMEVTAEGAGNAADLVLGLGYSPYRYDEQSDRLEPQALTRTEHVTGHRNWYFMPTAL